MTKQYYSRARQQLTIFILSMGSPVWNEMKTGVKSIEFFVQRRAQYACMLGWCVRIIHKDAKRENKKNALLSVVYAYNGKQRAAPADAMPTVLVMIMMPAHTPNNGSIAMGDNIVINPHKVATPLPPLPRKKIEQPLPNKSMAAKIQR